MAGSIADLENEDEFSEAHEINVTPFIDVMLVLLIIFMVAAPLSTVDLPVDLVSRRDRRGGAASCLRRSGLRPSPGRRCGRSRRACLRGRPRPALAAHRGDRSAAGAGIRRFRRVAGAGGAEGEGGGDRSSS